MIIPKVRHDGWGSGEFLARRRGAGGRVYQHKGTDFSAPAGVILCAPVGVSVVRVGWCYTTRGPRSEFTLIEGVTDDGLTMKWLYTEPSVKAGDYIFAGQMLGVVQDISKLYEGMLPHYHFEVIRNGSNIDPVQYLTERVKPAII